MSRKESTIAAILLIIIGTGMHFVHHVPWFGHVMGYVFPVTESVMAHMKMVFYPMLLLGVYLCVSRRDIREIGAPVLGSLVVMPMIVAEFFAYWLFIRHELLPLDIVIYVVMMVGAVHFANRWRKKEFVRRNWRLWLALVAAVVLSVAVLTYHSPDWLIFSDMGGGE